jgi:hypothetical protein
MRFARWVFLIAGIYGLVVLLPGLFLEQAAGQATPPPINHPEWYYGFYGSALAWQLVFLVIAQDPARYRPLMLAALVEKFVFPLACLTLLALGRLAPSGPLAGSLIDAVWLALFAVAYLRTAAAKVA